jgi:ferredoxin
MAMTIIADECTACGDCKPVCPTKSILVRKGVFTIDARTCTECEDESDEPQCILVCPVDNCIVPLAA